MKPTEREWRLGEIRERLEIAFGEVTQYQYEIITSCVDDAFAVGGQDALGEHSLRPILENAFNAGREWVPGSINNPAKVYADCWFIEHEPSAPPPSLPPSEEGALSTKNLGEGPSEDRTDREGD